MKKAKPLPLVSLRTRRIMAAVSLFCTVNYLLHLFPISVMSLLGWETDLPQDQDTDFTLVSIDQAMASFEFFVVLLLCAMCSVVLAVFVAVREVGCLLIVRGFAPTVSGRGYTLLFVGPLIAAGIPLMILGGGAEAFAGTRAAGVGIHALMFMAGLTSAGPLVFSVAYSLEPSAMGKAVKQSQRRSNSV